jgi:hypothetical protein
MSQVRIVSADGFLSHDSLFLPVPILRDSDSLNWQEATYAVRFSPLQCQETKHAF